MVNEPSGFEPLKFYCIKMFHAVKGALIHLTGFVHCFKFLCLIFCRIVRMFYEALLFRFDSYLYV